MHAAHVGSGSCTPRMGGSRACWLRSWTVLGGSGAGEGGTLVGVHALTGPLSLLVGHEQSESENI